MKVCWVKIWIASMATLTERFRDDEGRVDFEALGREEYAFRHALITGDYYKSERARDLAEAAEKDYKIHSENGKKGGRPKKLTAAAATREGADVLYTRESGCCAHTTGCDHSQEAPTRKAGDESSDAGNGAALKYATSCDPLTADGDIREDSLNVTDGSNAALLESSTSANHYDQEASPAGAGANLDSTQTNKRPDASSGNAEGVITNGSTISRNVSRAACTSAPSGQTIDTADTLDKAGAGGISPEVVEQASSLPAPSRPVKRHHGEFGNVLLTDDEFRKLCEKCADADSLITELDQYIESQGKTKKYKSHYATLLNWSRRKSQESKPKQGYMTSDDISKKNYEESKARLEAMFSKGRVTA